jgi:hypothetical protein
VSTALSYTPPIRSFINTLSTDSIIPYNSSPIGAHHYNMPCNTEIPHTPPHYAPPHQHPFLPHQYMFQRPEITHILPPPHNTQNHGHNHPLHSTQIPLAMPQSAPLHHGYPYPHPRDLRQPLYPRDSLPTPSQQFYRPVNPSSPSTYNPASIADNGQFYRSQFVIPPPPETRNNNYI